MPPCYSFNRSCVPDSGMGGRCADLATVCPVAWWFWVTATVAAIAVVAAKGSK